MVRLEGFMNVQQLHNDGVSISEIGRRLNLDRKTVRKYLKVAPQAYERQAKSWKVDPFRSYLRERWEVGRSERSPPVRRDPEARLCRLRDSGEEGGAASEERGPGASVRSF